MSKPNHAEQQVAKLAAERYQAALDRGARFSLDQLIDELEAELLTRFTLSGRSLVADLIRLVADSAVHKVDKTRTKAADQPTLLDDLDRAVPVGESQRRARRRMDNVDWANHLAHIADNAARVNTAAAKEQQRYVALAPYLARGLDTEASLRAWQADNSDRVLA